MEEHVELEVEFTTEAKDALDEMSPDLRREAWERIHLLSGNPVHPHPSLNAHRLKSLEGIHDKWECYVTMAHRIIYDFTDGMLRIWRVGDHSIVDRARNLSFAACTSFQRAAQEQPPSPPKETLFKTPAAWAVRREDIEPPFAHLLPAHLRVLGVPANSVKAVRACVDFAALEALGLSQQTCAWLEDLATSEASAAELFSPDDLYFKTTLSTLKGYCEGKIKNLMLNLEPEQEQYRRRTTVGPLLLRGCAGSGKTTVALYRALDQATDGKRVLFLTYSTSLAEVARTLLAELAGDPLPPELEVHTVSQWAAGFVTARGRKWTGIQKERQTAALAKAITTAGAAAKGTLRDPDFLRAEISSVIKAGNLSEDGYLHARRYGRGRALQESQRRAVWMIYQTYRNELAAHGWADWEDIPVMALQELDRQALEHPFDHVIVDEAQDLTATEIRLASRLGSSLFLVGDAAQSIYTRGYTWRETGLELQGRSYSLKRNFRNTHQVAEAAADFIRHNEELVASEDWVDPQFTRRSGPKPLILKVANRDREIPALCDCILDLSNGREFRLADFAVLCRFNNQCTAVRNYLVTQQIPASIRDKNSPFDILEQRVKVLTIHSAKGMEFPVVFVLGWHEGQLPFLPHATDPELAMSDVEAERMLAYVAMTRAAEVLYLVTSPDHPSRFLDEIPASMVCIMDRSETAAQGKPTPAGTSPSC